jgi:tetratricopeptide (TPR) repeat protein
MTKLFRTLLFVGLFSCGGGAFAGPPQADLDILFAKLRDPATGSEVLRIEPQIWDVWMHGGTDAENEQLAKATASMNAGAFALAEQQLTALLKTSPNYPEVWNKRATLYFLMGRMDDSLKDITMTLDLEPRHFGALSGRGMIYQRLGRNAEAISAFKEALSINPSMPGATLAVQQLEKLAPEL